MSLHDILIKEDSPALPQEQYGKFKLREQAEKICKLNTCTLFEEKRGIFSLAGDSQIGTSSRKRAARRIKRRVSRAVKILLGSTGILILLIIYGFFFAPGEVPVSRTAQEQLQTNSFVDPLNSSPEVIMPFSAAIEQIPPGEDHLLTGESFPETFASLKPSEQPPPSLSTSTIPHNSDPIQEGIGLMKHFFPKGGDFEIKVQSDKGENAIYVEGEKLIVHISSARDAYLQVDYYQADGTVVHLLPNTREINFVEGGKTLSIGTSKNGFQFIFTPPFGRELLTVIATDNPLEGTQEKPILFESATAYIERLKKKLLTYQTQGKTAGAYLMLHTQKPTEAIAQRFNRDLEE